MSKTTKLSKQVKAKAHKGKPPKAPTVKEPTLRMGKETATVESRTANIRTLDELLAICEVDVSVWEVDRLLVNKWEMGCATEDGDILVRPLFQVKASLKKRKGIDAATQIAKMFESSAKSHAPKKFLTTRAKSTKGDHLLEISIPDLHIGKLAWSKETGQPDYESAIACSLFKNAIADIIAKVPMSKVGRILLPIGNDFFNVDGHTKMTTGGTPQDEDGRWSKTFMQGCILVAEAAEQLSKLVPVDIVIVQGNHDFQRSFYLGAYLSAKFESHKAVTVDNEPTTRKYYHFGRNLLGFTHGDKEKIGRLPGLMAEERPLIWAQTDTREWHLGHLHTEIVQEIIGTKIRNLSSLSPADAWHAGQGYVGNVRRAEGFLYQPDGGLVANYYFIDA